MEFRVLQYFLAVTREQSISGAAEFLHLSQPTLSRQLKDLEDELGTQLFIRGNRKITLTEDGMLLRKRAEEITDLVKKTEDEITLSGDVITGDVRIGTGETDAIRLIARAALELHDEHPQIHYHISSGDSRDVLERLDKGLIDFGIIIGQLDLSKYNCLPFPVQDTWGVLMKRDSALAAKTVISPEDLWDKPLLMSRQINSNHPVAHWIKQDFSSLNILATYNLVYNASLLVDEGFGYAVTLDKLINTSGDSTLCFRPLDPPLKIDLTMVWKKYQFFSKAAEKFLEKIKEEF
ncbi:MAG: LysR family transcriptional regulator [Clostridia bacterium]|nr:LysR family transcriptional regulator [Clostridia bacterium]NCC43269.1 LysR family transcriptional regulator [Clostridia bacterium]